MRRSSPRAKRAGFGRVVAGLALVLAKPKEATTHREEVGNGGNQRPETANEAAASG
jgi:hypothetical protein